MPIDLTSLAYPGCLHLCIGNIKIISQSGGNVNKVLHLPYRLVTRYVIILHGTVLPHRFQIRDWKGYRFIHGGASDY